MAIDTTTPRSRRAVIAGALGGALASLGLFVKAPEVRAGTDGDVVLDATNTAAATTVINGDQSNPVFRVANADEDAVQGISANGVGLLGGSGDTSFPSPIEASTGVFGISVDGHGVYAASDTNTALYAATNATDVPAIVGESDSGDGPIGVFGHGRIGVQGNGFLASAAPAVVDGSGVHGHGGVGVYGSTVQGTGVFGRSGAVDVPFGNTTVRAITGVYGFSGHDANATGVAGETTVGVGTHGIATSGVGVRGQTTSGVAVKADTTSGTAVLAASTSGNGIRGRAGLDGVIGESPGGRSGVVGYSGTGSAPAGPAKSGVYGEATQDSAARGVFGLSLAGQGVRGEATTGQGVQGIATTGQAVRGDTTGGTAVHGQATSGRAVRGVATTGEGVRGEASTGIGVKAVATTGAALDVSGRAVFSRSGRVSVPANAAYVDVTVPGGLSSSANVLATLQYKRGSVHVLAARPNYPSSGKVRIYLSDVASTTATTPLAWFVLG
jgi:hypothetical protein